MNQHFHNITSLSTNAAGVVIHAVNFESGEEFSFSITPSAAAKLALMLTASPPPAGVESNTLHQTLGVWAMIDSHNQPGLAIQLPGGLQLGLALTPASLSALRASLAQLDMTLKVSRQAQ